MSIPVKIIEKTGDRKVLIKETDGKIMIKTVKDNKQMIEMLIDSISRIFGGGKKGMGDLFKLIEYVEDAKKVYIIVEKEEKEEK